MLRPRLGSLVVSLALVCAAAPARSALWPDLPDRLATDLASADTLKRKAAAEQVHLLGRTVGGPLAKKALVDSEVEVRLAGAGSAARLGLDDVEPLLLPWLTDADSRLREGACLFFARVPRPKLVKVLARSLGDTDPKVRLAAVAALGASGSIEAVAPLLARLDDPVSKVRVAVARALGRLGDKRAVTPLVSKIQDEGSDVRQTVARSLGELGDPKAAPALVIALKDPALEVRIEALGSLGRLRDAGSVPSIAPLALEPNKKAGAADVRRAALAALGRIGTPAAVEAIGKTFGLFEDDRALVGPSPAREAAVAAGATAVPVLLALLEPGAGGTNIGPSVTTAASPVATSAAWALGELHANGAGEAIVKAMRRGLVPLPVALYSLGVLGDATHLPTCLESVSAPDRAVRVQALAATAKLLDPELPDGRAVEPLLAALEVALSPEDRAEIAVLLGRTGADRVVPVLAGLTGSKDEKLRLAAIDALGAVGVATAGPTLLGLLGDPSGVIRLRAGLALGRAGGADSLTKAIDRLVQGTEVDRLAVILAISQMMERHGDAAAVNLTKKVLNQPVPERDLLVVAVGRSRLDSGASAVLAGLLVGADADLRRAVAMALGARVDDPTAAAPLLALAKDADATVRAQAAWSIGAALDVGALATLEALAKDPVSSVATNAAGGLGRLLARGKSAPTTTSASLCAALDDERALVRANALGALRLLASAGRPSLCGDGARVHKILAEDSSDVARAIAARLLATQVSGATPEAAAKARASLDRCALTDPSGAVASACRAPVRPIKPGTTALVVFVAPDDGGTPVPRAPYVLERPDGLLHVGVSDRRAAIVELRLPKGIVRLRPVGES
ncbi:MAG: HEAT repeat domain-containing protein [Myxococcales bacterium]|nr:HEAT repeat domain-containing protein [Myxococcales bacterium]